MTGPDTADAASAPDLTFADLGLDDRVLKALSDVGYESPSPIQAATIPPLLEGRDVVGLAQTGTGKTAAFALPILSRLDLAQKSPQALVLAPTRELALQVCEAFERYAGHIRGVHVLPVYGGQGYGVQLSALRRGVHVVVGTPGRIMDHLDKGTLDLSELRFLVLDEADEMLNMGFAEDVEAILAQTPEEKNVALFSATMPAQIRRISQRYLRDPAEITVKNKTATAANITQRYLMVSYPQKVDALTRILEVENFEGMIVFVRTKNETEMLAEKLRARGFSAMAINGDVAQVQRERTVNQLKSGKLDILVATDVAARGLDVERISHVVNYDIPTDTESYVHRIGRTGRAGRSGDAISFVTPRERYLLKHIEKATRQPLTQMQLPSVEDVNLTRLARWDDAITAALAQTGRVERFRDIIGHYVSEYDVPEVDVAAALAVVAQGDTPLLLDPGAEPLPPEEAEAGASRRGRREPGESRERGPRERRSRGRSDVPMATYRIAVGKRHKVEPRQIVGAIANEGGLSREDFGHIDIRADHSLVELPAQLPEEAWGKLKGTRISGKLIELAPTGVRSVRCAASPGPGPGNADRTGRAAGPDHPSELWSARHAGPSVTEVTPAGGVTPDLGRSPMPQLVSRRRRLVGALVALASALATTLVLTPAPASAAAPSYVALGDSYSSGVGTRSYIDDGTSCQRSTYAYPSLIAAARGYALNFRACSGAKIPDVTNTQLGALSATTSYVTISVGGNDAGFSSVLTECAQPGWMSDCGGAIDQAQAYINNTLPSQLSSLYAAIRSRAANAKVVVVGYPRLFMGEDCNAGTWFSPSEETRLNQTADLLNSKLSAAASARGFSFANPTSRFIGHAICDDVEWLNGLSNPVSESYHPNRAGHSSGYTPLVSPLLTGATTLVTAQVLRTAAASADGLAAQARAYAAIDARIAPERFVAPDVTGPQARAAARRAGIDLDRWLARQGVA